LSYLTEDFVGKFAGFLELLASVNWAFADKLPEIDDETQRRWMKEAVLELRSFYQPRPSIELLLTEDGIGVAKGFNLNPTKGTGCESFPQFQYDSGMINL
jgi:hypothetical protein